MMRARKDPSGAPTLQRGRLVRFLVYQYKLWPHCFRLLLKNRAAELAAALSYYTIFGVVPLAIVVVLVFQSFPAYRAMGEQLKRIAYRELNLTTIEYPDPQDPEERIVLTEYLDTIITRFFTTLNKESLGLISALIVIWAALRLLSIIESAFDHMWYVPHGRRFLHRIISYWAVLTLGPMLLAAGLYATTQYTFVRDIEAGVVSAVGPIVSYLVSLLALFLLYLVMPNAKVQASAALWGAAVAALIWSFAKWGFGIYVTELIPYSTVYGVLGLIPLGVFWVYITWLIVLVGVQLTFTIQHFEALEAAEARRVRQAAGRFIANDMTAIVIVRELARAFESGHGPVTTDGICTRLAIPGEFGRKLLDAFVDQGLLVRTSRPSEGYVLARAPERITLSAISDAVAAVSLGQPRPDEHGPLRQIAQAKHELLARHSLKDLLDASSSPAEERPGGASALPPQKGSPHGHTCDPAGA